MFLGLGKIDSYISVLGRSFSLDGRFFILCDLEFGRVGIGLNELCERVLVDVFRFFFLYFRIFGIRSFCLRFDEFRF